jgi:hypothetical protein
VISFCKRLVNFDVSGRKEEFLVSNFIKKAIGVKNTKKIKDSNILPLTFPNSVAIFNQIHVIFEDK